MSANKRGQKGHDLEETLKEYFWQAGYLAVRGVPYRIDDEDITDVDVWLYERPAALTRRRLIVDAKNKTKPKAAERLVWVRGLQSALLVDSAIVASTDKRPSMRRLAKSMGVTLLDGDAITKLTSSSKLNLDDQFASEDYDGLFKAVDTARRSSEWRSALQSVRSSLLTNFGIHSANTALRVAGLFAEQAVIASPKSDQAQTALRGFFSASAYAAIGLDYVLADLAFRTQEERRTALISGIRFGNTAPTEALTTVRAAIGLIRQHVSNGNSVAAQVERGFDAQAGRVPAEIIADHLARLSSSDVLFSVARELERNAFKIDMLPFDELSVDARALLGVVLDFHSISREKIANVVGHLVSKQLASGAIKEESKAQNKPRADPTKADPQATGSLFPEEAPKSDKS